MLGIFMRETQFLPMLLASEPVSQPHPLQVHYIFIPPPILGELPVQLPDMTSHLAQMVIADTGTYKV